MSPEALLLGCGRIGRAALLDLLNANVEVAVCEANEALARVVSRSYGVEAYHFSMGLESLLEVCKPEVVVSALPGSVSYPILRKVLKRGYSVVDVSYFPQDPFELGRLAESRGCLLAIDAGLSPGISNVLVGRSFQALGELEEALVYVGGLSKDPNAFLGLTASWNVEDLLDEYVRPARGLEDGRIKEVDPLSETGEVEVPGVGKFEYFVSDGLRTMLKTIKARTMKELTLRYPGHVRAMKLLRSLGMLEEKLCVDGAEVEARKVLAKLLEKRLSQAVEDRVVLHVRARGRRGGMSCTVVKDYDKRRKLTAMAATTGFTLSIVTQMLLKGVVDGAGLFPPEFIGMQERLFHYFLVELEKRNIKLQSSVSSSDRQR